ncbi:MAG: transcriptional activator NhaR [Pseudomonadota bacterium]
MRHLNYNHLLYFWTVAREGSIVKASETLHLTPQTISGQLKLLEDAVGTPLFHRVGRGLTLTDTGHVVNQYADEIFSLGTELAQIVKAEQSGAPVTLNVGIVNSIAKLITYRMLEPALTPKDPVKVTCIEGDLETLLGSLAVHRLDIVLSDRPIPHGLNVRAYNHSLGESSIAFFARSDLAGRYIKDFPGSLNDAPMLMPVTRNAIRRALDDWLDRHDLNPRVVAEFDDSALMKAFGEAGTGIFAAPAAIAEQVCEKYGVTKIGEAPEVKETYFAISPERRLKHPAVVNITEKARSGLFN